MTETGDFHADPKGPTLRDAIIFLPGLTRQWIDQSIDGFAQRTALALDRNSKSVPARFSIMAGAHDEEYGRGLTTQLRTICRENGSQRLPQIDIYKLDYEKDLTQRYEESSIASQSLLFLAAIILNTPRLIMALSKRSRKTAVERLQLLFAVIVLLLLTAYSATLLATAAATIVQALSRETVMSMTYLRRLQAAIIVVTSVGALIPPRFRQALGAFAVEYLSAIYYISIGRERNVILGRLATLLEHVLEKKDVAYRSIHLVGYSFGTVVALDFLFPRGMTPTGHLSAIHTLVTIGCPLDLVRALWPEYFLERQALPGVPRRWFNVYSPADVLASELSREHPIGLAAGVATRPPDASQATIPIATNIAYGDGRTGKVSFMSALMLNGLRAHSMYWEASFRSEISAIDLVVREMYQDDAMLD